MKTIRIYFVAVRKLVCGKWHSQYHGHKYCVEKKGGKLSVDLLCSLPFQGPKQSRFQGPPLQAPLVMDYSPIQIHKSHPI